MKKKVNPVLPKGFTAISFGGQSWKPEKPGDQIIGKLTGVKSVDLPKNGRIPARTVAVYSLTTDEGARDVWESGGLKALANVKKGQTVCIVFLGMKKLKGQANPMRDYAVGVK